MSQSTTAGSDIGIVYILGDVIVSQGDVTAVLFPNMVFNCLEINVVVAATSAQVGPSTSVHPYMPLYMPLDGKLFETVGALELVGVGLVCLNDV